MKRIISFSIILILIIAVLSYSKAQNKVSSFNRGLGTVQNENIKAHTLLYFPDNKSNYLIPEERFVVINESIEKTIVQELIKGTTKRNISEWMLKNAKLINIYGKADLLTLDFSREFVRSFSYSKASNLSIVYSIVNSLTELPGVNKILFKSNGIPIGIVGGIDFRKPLERNRSLFNRDNKLKPNEVLYREMSFEKAGKWLKSYLLMSDDKNNKSRKYYDAYIQEMSEMKYKGFLDTDFHVGSYKLDALGEKASVEVIFSNSKAGQETDQSRVAHFNTVKIQGVWMVDWLTGQ